MIESEQLYITAISTNDFTVTRGVNGTTAATHADSTDISIFKYPEEVVQACLIQTARLWKRKDSGFASGGSLPKSGKGSNVFEGLDADVKQLLSAYRRLPSGAGV